MVGLWHWISMDLHGFTVAHVLPCSEKNRNSWVAWPVSCFFSQVRFVGFWIWLQSPTVRELVQGNIYSSSYSERKKNRIVTIETSGDGSKAIWNTICLGLIHLHKASSKLPLGVHHGFHRKQHQFSVGCWPCCKSFKATRRAGVDRGLFLMWVVGGLSNET